MKRIAVMCSVLLVTVYVSGKDCFAELNQCRSKCYDRNDTTGDCILECYNSNEKCLKEAFK